MNKLENIDASLKVLCKYESVSGMRNVQIAQCRLERLEAEIESMENALCVCLGVCFKPEFICLILSPNKNKVIDLCN